MKANQKLSSLAQQITSMGFLISSPTEPTWKILAWNLAPFDEQIKAVLKGSFFQLRTVSKIKPFLNIKDLDMVISSRLDYYNSLQTAISQSSVPPTTGSERRNQPLHRFPEERQYHCFSLSPRLPVRFTANSKVLLLVYKALNGLPPSCITELQTPLLRSPVLRKGPVIAMLGPKPRNSIPLPIRSTFESPWRGSLWPVPACCTSEHVSWEPDSYVQYVSMFIFLLHFLHIYFVQHFQSQSYLYGQFCCICSTNRGLKLCFSQIR